MKKNSTKELDIQLNRNINFLLRQKKIDLPRIQVPISSTLLPNSELITVLPKKFRELRALAIASWYLPEDLKFEILISIKSTFPYNLDFENNGFKQSLELFILTESKEIMLKYLLKEENFTLRELFGTILREDIENSLRNLKVYWKNPDKPRKKVRRKGYRDQGSRRPDHLWLERFDISFTEQQILKEDKISTLVTQTSNLRKELESWDPE